MALGRYVVEQIHVVENRLQRRQRLRIKGEKKRSYFSNSGFILFLLKHEGALYKGISFARSRSLETGTMHFYASRSNRELISLRDRTRNYK